MIKFETKKERLYGTSKKFHYVTYFRGAQVGHGDTKELAETDAAQKVLAALEYQTSTIYASVTADGSVLTTRQYEPNGLEYSYHRTEDGRQCGSCMSNMQIEGERVTAAEYHARTLARYNKSVTRRQETPAA